MPRYEIVQSNEFITTHTGSVLVGELLRRTALPDKLNAVKLTETQSSRISNAEMVLSYIGVLSQGKPEYAAIEEFRNDRYFAQSLGIKHVPSEASLRQRFDIIGTQFNDIITNESCKLIKSVGATVTPCYGKHIPLDLDTTPMDNSKTKKEGVECTYKGFFGFAPMMAYLGKNEGYSVGVEMRTGSTHSQNGTPEFLRKCIVNSRIITDMPLLVRMDSGNDSIDNIKVMQNPKTTADFIIKRNLRKESRKAYYVMALERGRKLDSNREGKEIYALETVCKPGGIDNDIRMVSIITVRTSTPCGQLLMEPDIEVESYYTSLFDASAETIVQLYHEHGTMEQFHSEIKTDLDLERLPSGKFATNSLILHLGALTYNILRLIGQESLKTKDFPPTQHSVKRRRIRTVIQNYITIASKLVHHARKQWLKFGSINPWYASFRRIYSAFACG